MSATPLLLPFCCPCSAVIACARPSFDGTTSLAPPRSPSLSSALISPLPAVWPWDMVNAGPLKVSPMGFGTWAWGNKFLWGYENTMDESLQEAFNFAVQKGVNLFDTADSYGTGKLNGQSELLLGRFVEEFPECFEGCVGAGLCIKSSIMKRSTMYIASVGSAQLHYGSMIQYEICFLPSGSEWSQKQIIIASKFAAYPWRITAGQIVEACKASLKRLKMKQLGIGQLHWSTANYAPLQERVLWDGLVAMHKEGLVKAVGVSNYGPKQLLRIYDFLEKKGVPLISAQVQFSLLSMGTNQMTIKSICDNLGITLIAYSPLGLGMLTGKYSYSTLPNGPRLLFKQIMPGIEPLLQSLGLTSRRRRKTMSQVALNWCLCKGVIPIPGVKNINQVKDNIGALGWRLSTDEISQLEYAAAQSPKSMVQNIFQTK
ncbi:hypothetical protein O6H91_15G078900 [Diphasiastrum complanatum]|uniref:Uncharacterized protein n=1 Tax=Diphasiastrum complanatum TaxID=34168 RepID=A0ACC2BK24_DIPCM|nr:hypothetical protein O6H91_15G078900 [Diphasiastrum complanatum]